MTLKEALAILEVEANATPAAIQQAYRELVRVWHPDRFANSPDLRQKAQEKLKQINEAYETLKAAGFATGQAASDEAEPSLPYCDAEVRYLGEDPRLKPTEANRNRSKQQGVPAGVAITDKGISVVTLRENQHRETMDYPTSTLLSIQEDARKWVFPSKAEDAYEAWLQPLPDLEVEFRFSDPERVLRNGISLRLRFRNDYYAKVFVKRVRSAFHLVRPEPPKPPPPPRTRTPNPVLHPVTTIPSARKDQWPPLIAFLLLVGGMVLFAVVLIFVPDSHQRAARTAAKPNRDEQESIKDSAKGPPPSPDTTATPSIFVNSIGLKLKWIEPGEFVMGANQGEENEKPEHRVRITRGFYLGIYEVQQSEYLAVRGHNPSYFKGDQLPVECVSWNDANAFCEALTETELGKRLLPEGARYRLPTEAEWEFAAKAGLTGKWGHCDSESELHNIAWFILSSGTRTHPVGTKHPNPWGLYDTAGNVSEWCQDSYDAKWYRQFDSLTCDDPVNRQPYASHIFRGGGCLSASTDCRTAVRGSSAQLVTMISTGFRVALSF